jgi:hypothetical protein
VSNLWLFSFARDHRRDATCILLVSHVAPKALGLHVLDGEVSATGIGSADRSMAAVTRNGGVLKKQRDELYLSSSEPRAKQKFELLQ